MNEQAITEPPKEIKKALDELFPGRQNGTIQATVKQNASITQPKTIGNKEADLVTVVITSHRKTITIPFLYAIGTDLSVLEQHRQAAADYWAQLTDQTQEQDY